MECITRSKQLPFCMLGEGAKRLIEEQAVVSDTLWPPLFLLRVAEAKVEGVPPAAVVLRPRKRERGNSPPLHEARYKGVPSAPWPDKEPSPARVYIGPDTRCTFRHPGARRRAGTIMKIILCLVLVAIPLTSGRPRSKREAYDLPDGAELIVGSIKTSFTCPAKIGYFADVDNNCQIFHVCNPVTYPDGKSEVLQYSFFCGNQTVFNQLSLTCAWPEEAVPCKNAPDFFYVNDNIGIPDAPFLTDADVQKAAQLIPGYGQSKAAASNVLESRVPAGRGRK
ncbi:putative cuticular protein [Ixodes scapularis]